MKQSRLKLAIGMLALYLFEGILKAIFNGFPIEVVMGGQGFIAAYYFTVRTVSDNAIAKNCIK